MFCCQLLCAHSSLGSYLDGKENAGSFAFFDFLVSSDCCLAGGDTGLSAVCDCGMY